MDGIAVAVLLVGAGAIVFAAITYQKDHVEKPKVHRAHLLAQFNANRTITKHVIDSLKEYTDRHNCVDALMFPNMSYRVYIEKLETGLTTGNLSPRYIDVIRKEALSQYNIDSMVKSLETQYNSLQEILTTTQLLLKS